MPEYLEIRARTHVFSDLSPQREGSPLNLSDPRRIDSVYGADLSGLARLILGQGTRLTLLGVALGVAAAFAMTRLMGTLLYGVIPTDPLTFAEVALLLWIVALAACYPPVRRATKVDPMVALRHE